MKTTPKNTQGGEDTQKSDAFRWRSGLVGAFALGSVALVAGTLVKVFLNTDEYDGLHSLVSYSSRMIAGGFLFYLSALSQTILGRCHDDIANHTSRHLSMNTTVRVNMIMCSC